MSNERSDSAFQNWRDATERFDYYVVGIAGALVAYLGQALGPVRLSADPAGLNLLAVLLFLLAFCAGVRRIILANEVLLPTVAMLYKGEVAGELTANATPGAPLLNRSTGEITPPHWVPHIIEAAKAGSSKAEAAALKAGERAQVWAKASYWLLVAGFVAFIGAKIWMGYQMPLPPGQMPADSAPARQSSHPQEGS